MCESRSCVVGNDSKVLRAIARSAKQWYYQVTRCRCNMLRAKQSHTHKIQFTIETKWNTSLFSVRFSESWIQSSKYKGSIQTSTDDARRVSIYNSISRNMPRAQMSYLQYLSSDIHRRLTFMTSHHKLIADQGAPSDRRITNAKQI